MVNVLTTTKIVLTKRRWHYGPIYLPTDDLIAVELGLLDTAGGNITSSQIPPWFPGTVL